MNEFEEKDSFVEIEKLQPGWLDGEGKPISADVISVGRKVRDALRSSGVECCVNPTIEGGISIEERFVEGEDAVSFSITVNPDLTAWVMSFDDEEVDEDIKDARTLPESSPWLSAFLNDSRLSNAM